MCLSQQIIYESNYFHTNVVYILYEFLRLETKTVFLRWKGLFKKHIESIVADPGGILHISNKRTAFVYNTRNANKKKKKIQKNVSYGIYVLSLIHI